MPLDSACESGNYDSRRASPHVKQHRENAARQDPNGVESCPNGSPHRGQSQAPALQCETPRPASQIIAIADESGSRTLNPAKSRTGTKLHRQKRAIRSRRSISANPDSISLDDAGDQVAREDKRSSSSDILKRSVDRTSLALSTASRGTSRALNPLSSSFCGRPTRRNSAATPCARRAHAAISASGRAAYRRSSRSSGDACWLTAG